MLIIHRNYLIKDAEKLHAHVQVNPTGMINVEILEKNQSHSAEFEQLRFEQRGKLTTLVGKNTSNKKLTQWKLLLTNSDASELEILIEEATEQLELLMRDL